MFSPRQSQSSATSQHPVPQACAVSKPEHQGFGRAKHTTYLIKAHFGETQKSLVRRRFTDFVWLQQRLVLERAGIIVPVLPTPPVSIDSTDGSPVKLDKFCDEFVEQRQAKLDRFLQRIIDHDQLVTAECLWTFLTANPKDWTAAKKSTVDAKELTRQASQMSDDGTDSAAGNSDSITIDVASASSSNLFTSSASSSGAATSSSSSSTPKRKGWGQWMKETRTKFALSRGKLQLEETPAEAKTFGDLETYANHLDTCVQILYQDCQGYLKTQYESASKLQTMAAAFAELWGEHSLQNTSTSTMYQKLGETWASAGKQVIDRANECRVSFQDPLEELTLEVQSLKEALEHRKSTVKDYTKHYHHNQWLVQEMDKLKRPGLVLTGAKQDAFFQLEADIAASDAEVKLAKQQVEVVSKRLEDDIPRYRREFHQRMQKVMHDFHQTQSQFLVNAYGQTWASVLPNLAESLADAPSQPQLAPKKEAATLDVSFATTGAQISIADPNADGNATASPTDVPSQPSAPPPSMFAVPEPTIDDDDVNASFGAMSMLGEATAPPPGAAPPALPPPPVPTSDSQD